MAERGIISAAGEMIMHVRRLSLGDEDVAGRLFTMMAEVFEVEDCERLGDDYLQRLLGREDFWAFAAFEGETVIGGATAHTMPMTRSECSEIFLYDIAVRPEHQRKGVGRGLVTALREQAALVGIQVMFVSADNEDVHALDFYRALGGVASPVTFFTFTGPET